MKSRNCLFVGLCGLLMLGISCGEEKPEPEISIEDVQQTAARSFEPETILPDSVSLYEIARTSPLVPMDSDTPDSILGENANKYRDYSLVGLARTSFTVRGKTAQVEIARFGSIDDAFGFYAQGRPENVSAQRMGTEGYSLGAVTFFTQGTYVVSVAMEGDDFAHLGPQSILAREIENRIPDPTFVPQFFMLFPYNYKVVPSTQYLPRGFLDIETIDQVYSQRYCPAGDTLEFFLTMDTSGTKIIALREYAESLGTVIDCPEDIPFDDNHGVAFELPGHGTVVAGVIRSKLAGVIGHGEEKGDKLFANWVRGLQ